MTTENGATERTLGQLVADATRDLSSIIHSEIALAKAEIGADAKRVGAGLGLFAMAGLFAFLALILLLIAAAYGLVAAGLDPWLAFLIVAAVLLALGALMAVVGKNRVSKVKGKPERAIKSTQDTIAAIKPGNS
jgi:ABC-type nickel/cobalt efflux system permease component RcnA